MRVLALDHFRGYSMRFPVFVSTPNCLTLAQRKVYDYILQQMEAANLEPHTLGQSHQPTRSPLHEVLVIAKHVCGGVILGFEQFQITKGVKKPGTDEEAVIQSPTYFPTPWNQLEAGILYSVGVPLLIFRENSISGGIFDQGVTDWYTHRLPTEEKLEQDKPSIAAVFSEWQSRVRERYYNIL